MSVRVHCIFGSNRASLFTGVRTPMLPAPHTGSSPIMNTRYSYSMRTRFWTSSASGTPSARMDSQFPSSQSDTCSDSASGSVPSSGRFGRAFSRTAYLTKNDVTPRSTSRANAARTSGGSMEHVSDGRCMSPRTTGFRR